MTMLKDSSVKFNVIVNGIIKGKFETYNSAEFFKMSLQENERMNAVILPMTDDDRQVLLG